MGSGGFTRADFDDYSYRSKGVRSCADGSLDIKMCATSQIYKARDIDAALNPKGVIRECCDSEEHPNTVPVILALDVTGSMGSAANEVAAELGNLMEELYKDESIKDIEFMIMGIGDFAYDDCPLQVSQFESDIRIAEQLDKVYFEFGGGGNNFESYSAAWAFANTQTKLDCWKRGKKGIIITMGDENLNPYINADRYKAVTDYSYQAIETPALYDEVKNKYDVFHINVIHDRWGDRVDASTWTKVIGHGNYFTCEVKAVPQTIVQIIKSTLVNIDDIPRSEVKFDADGKISW